MKLNLITPINKLGYGVCGVNLLKALIKQSHEVSLFPVGPVEVDPINEEYVKKGLENANYFSPFAHSVVIWHAHGLKDLKRFKGKCFGWPIFELTQFNTAECEGIHAMDQLITCSSWGKSVLNRYTSKPIHVVPLGVDSEVFKREVYSQNGRGTLNFLNIGKWEIRKGHDVILRVFKKFIKDIWPFDAWKLTLCCHNPFLSKYENDRWANQFRDGLGNKVEVIENRLTNQSDVVELMNRSHVGIFPARAEGWNLELLEMMSLGKPCLTTNYSAHTEFCNKNNSYLVDLDGVEKAYDGSFFFGAGEWGKITEETEKELLSKLTDICRDWCYDRLINPLGICEEFSWEKSVEKLLKVVS